MSDRKHPGVVLRMYETDADGTKREVPLTPLPSTTPSVPRPTEHTRGTVEVWHVEEGWGVIASDRTPGGCWVHYSHIAGTGFRSLTVGQVVDLEFEDLDPSRQDGYQYRAVSVTES